MYSGIYSGYSAPGSRIARMESRYSGMRVAPKQTLTCIIPIILIPDWSQTNTPLIHSGLICDFRKCWDDPGLCWHCKTWGTCITLFTVYLLVTMWPLLSPISFNIGSLFLLHSLHCLCRYVTWYTYSVNGTVNFVLEILLVRFVWNDYELLYKCF